MNGISDHLIPVLVIVPLLGAALCVLSHSGRWSYWIALAASGVSFASSVAILSITSDDTILRYAIGGWAAPTGIEYRVDLIGAMVATVVSLVSMLALIYSPRSIEREIMSDKHYILYCAWLLCQTGLLGMVVTGDAFNVFVFLEISSLSTYTLIALNRNRPALLAAFRYLIIGSIGASFILLGIGFLYAATGTLNMVDLAERIPHSAQPRTLLIAFSFLTVGLMIKAAVFPLHAWLADAYHYAPASVTAFLAGTATKVSLYVLLRFFFTIFEPTYSFGQMLLSTILMPGAALGFVLMSLVAVFQTDLRRMLAYSSVAQIGYIVAGVSLMSTTGLTAAIVHIVNHALIKAALFMSVGCMIYRLGHAHRPSLDFLVRRMPFTVTAFIVSGLSLIGVPLTAGFVSKVALVSAALERNWWTIAFMVLVSSVLAIIYITRTAEVMLFRGNRVEAGEPVGLQEAPLSMLLPMWTLIIVSVASGIFSNPLLSLANQAALQLAGGGL